MIYRTLLTYYSLLVVLIYVQPLSSGAVLADEPIQTVENDTGCEELNKPGWNIITLQNVSTDARPWNCLRSRFSNDSLDELVSKYSPDIYNAASNGHLGFFQYHANKPSGAYELNAPSDEDKVTPAELAAANGHLAILKYILARENINQYQMLMLVQKAVRHSQLAVVDFLLDERSLLSNAQQKSTRILREAAQSGNVDMLKYLVEKRNFSLNVNATNLLYASVRSKTTDMLKYLIEERAFPLNASDENLLRQAAATGDISMFKYLVEEKHLPVNVNDTFLLCAAAVGGNVTLIKYLMHEKNLTKYRAIPSTQNTTLYLAALTAKLEVVRFLVETLSYEVDVKNVHGETPSHYAAIGGSIDVLKYLIEQKDSDLNVRSDFGDTLLHCACRSSSGVPAVKYLVEDRRMDVELKNSDAATPLYTAVFYGKLSVVKYLAGEKKADLSVTAIDSHNLLHIAALRSNFNTMRYLLEEMKMAPRIGEVDAMNCTITTIAARCSREYQIPTRPHGSHVLFKYLVNEKHAPYADEYCAENCKEF